MSPTIPMIFSNYKLRRDNIAKPYRDCVGENVDYDTLPDINISKSETLRGFIDRGNTGLVVHYPRTLPCGSTIAFWKLDPSSSWYMVSSVQ